MITVKVMLQPKSSDMTKNIITAAYNAAVESIAKSLREKVKNMKCKDHPNSKPVITIRADANGKYTVLKDSFCCNKFKESIQVK